jgi:hypothetical protein
MDMSKPLTDVMKRHLAHQAGPAAAVFPGRESEMPMYPVTFLGRWTKLVKRAGVTTARPMP